MEETILPDEELSPEDLEARKKGLALVERIISKEHDTMVRILSRIFATEVSDVRACRKCGCPVVHMEHLTLDEARAIETEVRELLGIPASLPDEV